ncbi:MAG TPA: VWA domain-containing protein [Gemmatimonadales bacterium]|nr:VWA domain-containing protein [Gemmatimonadales bacterium]
MSFAWPLVLLLALVLVPFGARAVLRGLRRREEELRAFGEPEVMARGSVLGDAALARRRAWLQLAAVGFGLVALARPQLGERQAELARTGRDLLLVLDLSRSMTVTDVAPNRLAAAKAVAWETVSASPGDRVGLIVFGGSAFLQLPLTSDHAALKLFLDAASPDDLGDPATDIGTALATAGKVFEHEGDRGHRAVLLVSDGESGEGDLEAATKSLRADGIPVFALGVGTTGGGPVPADSSEAPEKFHRDHIGRIAMSRLDENDLRTAAKLTGGAYARADRAEDRQQLRTALTKVRSRMLSARKSAERADRFQWPLALAVAALLGDLALAWLAARRRRAGGPGRAGATGFASVGSGAEEAGVRGAAALASAGSPAGAGHVVASLLMALLLANAGCSRGSLDARKGERLYASGDFAESAKVLDRALAADSTPVRAYNAGNAYYRMRRYEDAAVRYRLAAAGPAKVRQPSVFNLGNALVRAAEEAPERGQLLLDAIAAYEEALRLDPADHDAKWNLELALQRLEEDRMAGGSSGRGRAADYGRGNMNVPGYEGNPDAASGAMAGGGYGAGEGESVDELDADQARQLLEAVQREQLASHQGRPSQKGATGDRDW